MSKNKLKKFAEMGRFPNVFQNFDFHDPQLIGKEGAKADLKGKWRGAYFENQNPITLELACGRGEYTVNLARQHPERNFIGVDVKGARMHKGAKMALDENLNNVAFLRIRIEQIDAFFENGEVGEIWITFPDPFLKPTDRNKRLTSPPFLGIYRNLLSPPGTVHLKTDSGPLFEYTKQIADEMKGVNIKFNDPDIYKGELPVPELEIKTHYEKMHLADGKDIKYIQMEILASKK